MKNDKVKEIIRKNFENEYNAIPSGFVRMANRLPGIVKGDLITVTGNAGVGKWKFVQNYYMYNPLNVVREINDPDKLDVKFFIVLLKTSPVEFKINLYSRLLAEKYGIKLSYRQMLSIVERKSRKLTREILDKLDELDEFFTYFDSKVTIITERKPTKILTVIDKWSEMYGYDVTDGVDKLGIVPKHWKYHNPNLFPVIIVDDITRLSPDKNPHTLNPMDLRTTINFFYEALEERGKFKEFCSIVVHRQAADKERVESDYTGRTKEEKVEPSIDGLAESKVVDKYTNLVLGLFSPINYAIKEHAGYNIEKLRENYVSLNVLKSSYMKRNTRVGLWADLSIGKFEELPRADFFKGDLDANTETKYANFIAEKKNGI